MKKLTGILAAAAISATLAAMAIVGTASAHAHYISSTPAKSAVLTAAPTSVSITFAEEIQNTAGSFGLTVLNKDGGSAEASAPKLASGDAKTLTVNLKSGLANGRYEVHWNNVSSVDGDAATGAFSFYIGVQPTAADLAADEELAMIGAEEMATETPMPEMTQPASAPTVIAPAPQATAAASKPAAGGTLPKTGDGGSSGGSGGTPFVAVVLLATAMLALGGGIIARRRA
jgi:methionine-rich copper-binding protein CopC